MIYLMLSFTENIMYGLIFSVKYNLRERRSTLCFQDSDPSLSATALKWALLELVSKTLCETNRISGLPTE